MCRSIAEGGQRCAAHTRAKYQALLDIPIYRRDSTWKTRADEAATEYASTNEGQQHFEAKVRSMAASGLVDEEYRYLHILEAGRRRQAANAGAAQAIAAEQRRLAQTGRAPITDDSALRGMEHRTGHSFPDGPWAQSYVHDDWHGQGRRISLHTQRTPGVDTTTTLKCYTDDAVHGFVVATSTGPDDRETTVAQHDRARRQVLEALNGTGGPLRRHVLDTLNAHLADQEAPHV